MGSRKNTNIWLKLWMVQEDPILSQIRGILTILNPYSESSLFKTEHYPQCWNWAQIPYHKLISVAYNQVSLLQQARPAIFLLLIMSADVLASNLNILMNPSIKQNLHIHRRPNICFISQNTHLGGLCFLYTQAVVHCNINIEVMLLFLQH